MKFTLREAGVFFSMDHMDWQNYHLIDMAIEHGFVVNQREYEVAVALLRANAVDDQAAEWLSEVSTEALSYLNEECVYPGMVFTWEAGELLLIPDFEYDTQSIIGRWFTNDIEELYGVGVTTFAVYLHQYDLGIEYTDDDDTVRVVSEYASNNA